MVVERVRLLIWMMCLLLTTVHHWSNYLIIPASKTQHQQWLVGLSGVHLHVIPVAMEVRLLLPVATQVLAVIATRIIATAVMTFSVNHFQQQSDIITQSHFGCIKVVEVLASSTPISANRYFRLNCTDETNKSKVLWLFTTFHFHFFVRFYRIILSRTFLHKFRIFS